MGGEGEYQEGQSEGTDEVRAGRAGGGKAVVGACAAIP